MPKILKIIGQEIDQALRNVTRQYLVGDLQKPQALQHVPSSLIEIGITRYENEGKLEPPHQACNLPPRPAETKIRKSEISYTYPMDRFQRNGLTAKRCASKRAKAISGGTKIRRFQISYGDLTGRILCLTVSAPGRNAESQRLARNMF